MASGKKKEGRRMFRKALSIVEALTAMIVVMGIATVLRLTLALEFFR
jgi:hypothetical protein